jgi:UDP-2,4-diacetamido-2,4,6-trideoxy-beta-L-altropyranose hydrolase
MYSKILIRVDASNEIGLGHLIRCLIIADYLRANNHKIIFITKSDDLKSIVVSKGFEIRSLDNQISDEDEVHIIRDLVTQNSIKLIFLDINNYHTFNDVEKYSRYLKALKEIPLYLISFEDFKVHPSISDLIVIPYVGAEALVPTTQRSKYLLGAKYFVLRNDFLERRHSTTREIVKNILITMGGSDPTFSTIEILKAFVKMNVECNLMIIVGDLSRISDDEIKKTLVSYNGVFTIYRSVNDMAQLMAESDIAIISSGLTKYETASIGIPSIVISANDYHARIMDSFSKCGSVIHLGVAREDLKDKVIRAFTDLTDDYPKRTKMAEAGKALVDGNGLDRIYSLIPDSLLSVDT